MIFTFVMLLSLKVSAAHAQPSPEVLARLKNSFEPGFKVTRSDAGQSDSSCPLTDVKLLVTDPVTKKPGFVQARIYAPTQPSDRTVILLPPTGGENVLDRGYSDSLCSAGFKVVLLQTWFKQTESTLDMGMHDNGAVRSLSAIRHVLDYLKPSRATQVVILGTSVGALSSSLALGFDARLNAAVLIVGGVGVAEIIAASTEQGAAKLRRSRMKAFGFKSYSEYLSAMRKKVLIEPADFVNYSGQKTVLAFVGGNDVTVPTKHQLDLVRAFGAEADEYPGDHLQTIIHTAIFKKSKITDFFQKNLR